MTPRIFGSSTTFILFAFVGCSHDEVRSSTEGAAARDASLVVSRPHVALPPSTTQPAFARPLVEQPPLIAPAPVAPRPREITFTEIDGTRLRRLIVTSGVEDREPIDAIDIEHSVVGGQGPVYAFLDVANTSDEERKVSITFEREGHPAVGHVELSVPPHVGRWRTWGRSRMLSQPGTWNAVVRTSEGEELGRFAFVVR